MIAWVVIAVWAVIAERVISMLYNYFNNQFPKKIYIMDLQNTPRYMEDLTAKDSVYIGFLTTNCKDIDKYSDWKRCGWPNFAKVYKKKGPKLIYVTEDYDSHAVEYEMAQVAPEIISFVKQCCSPKSTIYLDVGSSHTGFVGTALQTQIFKEWMSDNVKIHFQPYDLAKRTASSTSAIAS